MWLGAGGLQVNEKTRALPRLWCSTRRPNPPTTPSTHTAHTAGPVGVTAAAAAIKWIVKDGIGAAGRFLVGGRLGVEVRASVLGWGAVGGSSDSVHTPQHEPLAQPHKRGAQAGVLPARCV